MKSDPSNWIEFDYNPFMVFNNNGDIININRSAQFLIDKVSPKVFFDLALLYAPMSFGFKTNIVELKYGKFNFFAITVGYDNEDEIGIKLYQTPYILKREKTRIKNLEPSNIYLLIDTVLASVSINYPGVNFKKEIDPTIPEIKISQNEFSKLLRKIYESFLHSKNILTVLKIKAGESVFISNKKYSLIEIKIEGDEIRKQGLEKIIEEISSNIDISVFFYEKNISIDIPVIL